MAATLPLAPAHGAQGAGTPPNIAKYGDLKTGGHIIYAHIPVEVPCEDEVLHGAALLPRPVCYCISHCLVSIQLPNNFDQPQLAAGLAAPGIGQQVQRLLVVSVQQHQQQQKWRYAP